MRSKSILGLSLLVFAAFTNLTAITVHRFGIPLMQVLFVFVLGTVLFAFFRTRQDLLVNYRNRSTKVISAFFFIFLVLGLINANVSKAITSEIYPLGVGFFIFLLVLLSIRTQEELDNILLAILLSGPLLAFQGGYQFIRGISAGSYIYFRADGWWPDPNAYSFVLCLVYLISFYFLEKEQRTLRRVGYLAQFSAAVGIILSVSRGGFVVFILISLLNWRFFWRQKGYLKVLMVFALILYLVVFINIFNIEALKNLPLCRLYESSIYDYSPDGFFNGRLTAAVTGLLIYARHPLAGAGFGNILDYADEISHIKMYTHNMFIEILAIGGPLPFLGYLFMLGYLWFSIPRNVGGKADPGKFLSSFIVALAAMGLFSHYLLYMKPFWILLALFPIYGQLAGSKK